MTAVADVAIGLRPIADMLEELRSKNHVRVTKYEAVRLPFSRTIRRRVMDEVSHEGAAHFPALLLQDSLRMLNGQKPIWLPEALRRLGGDLRSITPNLRTNVGIDFCATQLGSSSPTTQADYIALSNNNASPAATDTSSTHPWDTAAATDAAPSSTRGEYTALGLARKQATYAHTTGVASYSQTATWTATGAITSAQMAGMFGGSSRTAQGTSANNILFLENTFTPTSLAVSDQLSLAWTVSI